MTKDEFDSMPLEARLRAPAYWMSGSGQGHEGENDLPFKAADEIERLHRERDRAREMVSLMLKSVHERGSLKVEIGDGPYTVLLNIRDALEVRLGADTEQLLGSFTP